MGPGGDEEELVRGTREGSTLTLEDRPVTQLEKRTAALHPTWFPSQVSSKDPACSLPHPPSHHAPPPDHPVLHSAQL